MQSFLPFSGRTVAPACTLATVALLAACGGGGDSTGAANVTAFAATGTAEGIATTADATTWTTIASEGASYTVSGTQTVRYGAGTAWITLQVTGGGSCTNAAFGSDPAYGVAKSCQVASADSTASSWSKVAAEGQDFTATGTVRYGAGTSFVTRTVSGTGNCSNAYFGSDPAYGVVKECDLDTSSAAATWTKVADENAAFTVSGTQTVRYGAGTSFVTKWVTGSGTCSNAYFGSDPAVGVVKECDVALSTGSSGTTTAAICTPPATAADTSAVVATVGNGSAASCTEAALRAAVGAYATVRFNCGTAAVTIPISATIALPTERDTTIDGGGTVTLDGQNAVRILSHDRANYRANTHTVTLQHIALVNGKAPGGGYVAPSTSNPACAYGYKTGGGAAIYVSDAKLYVFDTDFRNNAAATPGPDIGGGAIYAAGSLDVLISGSRFSGNSGANGGAVGMLNSNLRIYNSSFNGNAANGGDVSVANADTSACPGVAYAGQAGSGGGGGAVSIDGGDDTDVTVCGSTFSGNSAVTQAGALQRVADLAARKITIDRSAFTNNKAQSAGALYLQNQAPLSILASTISGNQAVYAGAGQLQSNTFGIVNTTIANNTATRGVAGGFLLSGNSSASTMQNVTFSGNRAAGGNGYFAAAVFGDTNYTVANSVFANNTSDDPYNPMQCGFSALGGANDLQWPRTRSAGGATDTVCVGGITFADPLLGALADNGGSTPTLLPAASSPLRGAGRNCPTTDQRGNARSSASCTIGAVE